MCKWLGIAYQISIHAPREGSDENRFYLFGGKDISIHAPREGSDSTGSDLKGLILYFNPRSP